MAWHEGFVRTFLERDIPQLGVQRQDYALLGQRLQVSANGAQTTGEDKESRIFNR